MDMYTVPVSYMSTNILLHGLQSANAGCLIVYLGLLEPRSDSALQVYFETDHLLGYLRSLKYLINSI